MLGLIKRNLKHCSVSPKLKQQAYVSLVRPHLEYCSTVWNPHQQSYINQLEAIQRRSARFVKNLYQRSVDMPYRTESVTAMLQDMKWESLQVRRETATKTMMYKIANGLIAINKADYLSPLTNQRTRSFHPNKFQPLTKPSSKDVFKHSFMPTAVRLWNSLPGDTISAPTLSVFRTLLAPQ